MAKRIFDLILSGMGLMILIPFLPFLYIVYYLMDEFPVFYLQTRVGIKGKPFKICKLRTMVDKPGKGITVGKDSRITPLGSILRKYKIDELPQLWNVFKGDMSFVGPRPEVRDYVDTYTEKQQKVLTFKPGITDPASIRFRNEAEELAKQSDPDSYYKNKIMPEKIRLNIEYHQRSNLLTDIGIILKTLHVSAFGSQ